jgi:hypothetical protein
LDNSTADTNRDGLCAIACPELIHDVLDVNFYRLFCDQELVRDIAIPVPSGDLA